MRAIKLDHWRHELSWVQQVDNEHCDNDVCTIENIEVSLGRLRTTSPTIRELYITQHVSGTQEQFEGVRYVRGHEPRQDDRLHGRGGRG